MKKIFLAVFMVTLLLLSSCSGSTKISFDIPDGFTATEMEGLDEAYIAEDGSNINLLISYKTRDFDSIDQESWISTIEDMYYESLGVLVDINIKNFDNEKICGYPSYQIEFTCDATVSQFTQLVVTIDADKTYTITYTDSNGTYMDAFRNSADSIELE